VLFPTTIQRDQPGLENNNAPKLNWKESP